MSLDIFKNIDQEKNQLKDITNKTYRANPNFINFYNNNNGN